MSKSKQEHDLNHKMLQQLGLSLDEAQEALKSTTDKDKKKRRNRTLEKLEKQPESQYESII